MVWLWGLAATALLTTLLRAAQALRWTRMDIPFLLGTMFTADREKAKALGVVVHFLNGWAFAWLYAAFFRALGGATVPWGMAVGAAHALFVLAAVIPALPSAHPRMASEAMGPEPTRMLEPPGFLALNYGVQTPAATVLAHLLYGGVLGWGLR